MSEVISILAGVAIPVESDIHKYVGDGYSSTISLGVADFAG